MNDRDLARGPARLCAALGSDRSEDGTALGRSLARASASHCRHRIRAPRRRAHPHRSAHRVWPGGDGKAYPWRFWLEGEPTVSPYKTGGASAQAGKTMTGLAVDPVNRRRLGAEAASPSPNAVAR